MDLLSYSATGNSSLSGNITLGDYQSVINLAVLMLALLVWMMFGKKRQVMENHVDLLVSKGNIKKWHPAKMTECRISWIFTT